MLTSDLSVLDEVHICPHCDQQLSCCEAPPIHVGDGLGWGSDVLFICLNDYCKLFLKGWDNCETKYGHHASYRFMKLPGSTENNVMMVGNSDAFKGSIVDPKTIQKQNDRFRKEQEAVAALDTCVEENNIEPVMTLILDEAAILSKRKRAVELLLVLNDLSFIDAVRNHKFRENALEQATNLVISALLKRNFKKECQSCGEIIKAQAKKCMHCNETFE